MEVVNIDGVEYMKAAVAAKKFKYTSDYVGQLCRARKVDAKLVGRAWFINVKSLENHKTGRSVSDEPVDEKAIHNSLQIKESRLDVESVMRGPTVKITSSPAQVTSNFSKRMAWNPVRYEEDESDLLPKLARVEAEPVSIPVDIADATKVRIRKTESPTFMVAESLPEVSLRGSLKVNSLDPDYDNIAENIDIPDEIPDIEEVFVEQKVATKSKAKWQKVAMTKIASEHQSSDLGISDEQATYEVEINLTKDSPKDFTPSRFRAKSPELDDVSVRVPVWLWISVSVSVLLLLATASLEVSVLADSATYKASIILAF